MLIIVVSHNLSHKHKFVNNLKKENTFRQKYHNYYVYMKHYRTTTLQNNTSAKKTTNNYV